MAGTELPARWSFRLWSKYWDKDRVVLAAATLVMLVPLASVCSALRNPWVPASDWALIEQHVRDVGTADTPLTGAYSRFGWHHPGPWAFYLMAPFYRLAPVDQGLLFAAAMVNLLVVAACVLVVVRFGRTQALVALAGLAVLLRGLGAGLVSDPWNPNMAILPFALFLVLCVDIARGNRSWAIPLAVAAGALAVQSHLGLGPPVVLATVATFVLARRFGAGACPSRRLWWATGVVAVVAWLPALLDQVAGTGNVGKLARWSSGREVEDVSVMERGRLPPVTVRQFTAWLLDPFGLGLGHIDAPSDGTHYLLGGHKTWRLLLPVAMVAGALLLNRLVVTWRAGRADRSTRTVQAGAVLAAVGGLSVYVGVRSLRGVPFLWGLRWVAVVTMLVWVALGWALAAMLCQRWPSVTPLVQAAALAAVAVPVAWTLGWGSLGEQPFPEESALWLDFRSQVLAAVEGQDVVVIEPGPFVYGDQNSTLKVILERAGIRWVDGADPEARGRPIFYAMRTDAAGIGVTSGVVARSEMPPADADRIGAVLLIRVDPPP